jgi:zinc transport system substrate-binding protein
MNDSSLSTMLSRRSVLTGGAGMAAAGLAGCLSDEDPVETEGEGDGGDGGDEGEGEGEISAVAGSFFMLYDLARNVAGEQLNVEDLVPTGAHGDDWEPDPGIIERVGEADVYVYIEGFRSWSDDVAESLPQDYPDTVVVDAAAGIEYTEGEEDREEDPHFWMDPLRAQEAVGNIREGFAEADPDHEEVYEENAGTFVDELDALHGEFEAVTEARERDLIIVASHDSYQYWSERYGIEVYSPIGISPDAEPSAQELERVEELIEEYDIEHVLYDMYEPTDYADSIAEETGTETLPLSPIEATTEEQLEEGMGYLEHQREINLETLERALGSDL